MKCVVLALACLGAPAYAAAPPAPTIHDFTLGNGLRVLVVPRPESSSVAVQVFYHAGSKDEEPAYRGIAHLFEHMMFKGTSRVPPEEHARYINRLGGENNAFTTDDFTGYIDAVPPAALDFALSLEADRMRGLRLSQAMLDSEREVVKEELRMRFENNPIMQGVQRIMSLAYVKHPYGMMAIGTKESLDAVTLDACRRFYDRYYQPNNALLVLVGAVTAEGARALVEKRFGSVPRGAMVKRTPVEEPPQTSVRRATLELPMALPVVLGAYHVPGAAHPDLYALAVLQEILSSGESSRLYRRIVQGGLGVFAGGFLFDHEEPGLFVTFAQLTPGSDPAKVQQAFDAELARVTKESVTPAELKKAKNQLAMHALDERERAMGLASAIGSAAFMKGDPLAPFHDLERYDAVTAADVLRVARTYLVETNQTALRLIPTKKAPPRAEAAAAAKPAAPPTPPIANPLVPPRDLPPPRLQLGDVVRETLGNGIDLIVVPRHDLPVAQVVLSLPTGNHDAPIERMGLTELTVELLRKGAGKRTGLQIAEAVDGVGGSLATEVGDETSQITCRVRADDLPLCLELVADLAMRPTFPEPELKQVRTELLASVQELRDEPRGLATAHAAAAYFGEADPRGRSLSERSLALPKRKDLVAFHLARFRPDGATLVVAGDVDAGRLKTLLDRPGGLGGWKRRGPLPDVRRALPAPRPLRVRVVDKPDATQTTFLLVGPGIAHAAPDLHPFEYANYILGGGDFSSRLMKVVRADGGKTYGVSSRFETGRDPGTVHIATSTRVAESGRTMKLVLDEVAKLRRDGPTQVELDDARGNLVGELALKLETPEDVARTLLHAHVTGLPPDFVAKVPAARAAVTLADVKQAAAAHLAFETLVAVGPETQIRPLLSDVGLKIDEVVAYDVAVNAADRKK